MRDAENARDLSVEWAHLGLEEVAQACADLRCGLRALALRDVPVGLLEEAAQVVVGVRALFVAHPLVAAEAHLSQARVVDWRGADAAFRDHLGGVPRAPVGARVDAPESHSGSGHSPRRGLRHAHSLRGQVGVRYRPLEDLRAIPCRLAMAQEVYVDRGMRAKRDCDGKSRRDPPGKPRRGRRTVS